MKKIILILSMLISFQACHAIGVDCWEEYTDFYTPNTVSKMKNVIGSSATIVLVNTQTSNGIPIYSPIENNGYYLKAENLTIGIDSDLYGTHLGYAYTIDGTRSNDYYKYTRYLSFSGYKLTYCIVNDSSGGSSSNSSSAGAAVNYIIKAR